MLMSYPVRCTKCVRTGWAGCGQHVGSVMQNVPPTQRCTCREVPDDDPRDCGWPADGAAEPAASRPPRLATAEECP